MTAPAPSQPAASRRRWYEFTLRGALVVVPLIVLGLVAWRAYVDLPSGVEWPWFAAVVPAGLAAALALVEALMNTRAASQSARPRLSRYQFSLRGALLFVTLIVLGLVAWRAYEEPYREARGVMALVERLGGRCATRAGGPAWLRNPEITLIDLSDAQSEDYLDFIVGLPRLETLIVGGDDFTDEHLAKLGRIRSLRGLVLDSTDVSDEAICQLRTHLPDLRVHRSQRRDRNRFGGGGHMEVDLLDLEPWDLVSQHVSEHFVILVAARLPRGVVNGDEELAVLRRLPTVRSLSLSPCTISSKNGVTDAGLEAVAGLRDLDTLSLPDTLVTDAGLEHLTQLKHLQSLDLTNNPQLTDAGLTHIGRLSGLNRLVLTGTSIGDAGLERLRGLTNLETLELRSTLVSDAGLKHLRGLTKLKSLDLGNTRVSDEGLADLKELQSLNMLLLSNTTVTGPGLRHLASLPTLAHLNLENCPITDDGLEAITAWANPQPWLILSGTRITDKGIGHLARIASWRVLDLSKTRITNAALDALRDMDHLTELCLIDTAIDDAGAAKLKRVRSLRSLDCRGSHITAEGQFRLNQALPNLRIR